MYHLIVTSNIINDQRATILKNRVFEYTDKIIESRFIDDNGELILSEIIRYPAIIMDELGAENEMHPFYIARIYGILNTNNEYEILYQVLYKNEDIPFFDIFQYSRDLSIGGFEFTRNHWAIKDVDLFEVLFRNRQSLNFYPSVFELDLSGVERRLISFMMPFSKEFDDVYQDVKNALESRGFECTRADDFWQNDIIMNDIISLICRSEFIICDFTGKNPNVFYETGIAHTLGKNVIIITQNEYDVPFDLRHIRYIHYLNNREGRKELVRKILNRIESLEE